MKNTIFVKLLNSYLLIILVVFGVLGTSLSWMFKEYLFDQKERQLTFQGKDIASLVAPLLIMQESTSELINLLNRADLALGREIWVIDLNGIVLAAAAAHEYCEGTALESSELEEIKAGNVAIRRGTSQYFEEPVIRVTVPVINPEKKPIGAVILYSPIFEITETFGDLMEVLFVGGLISMLIAFVVALFLSKRISNPMFELVELSTKIANGERDITYPEGSEIDEINHLSKTISSMVGKVEENDRRMRNFVSNVSHELRTPLTTIKGFTEALKDNKGKNPADRERFLDIIHREVNRLSELIDTLLFMSKSEGNPLIPEKFELGAVVVRKIKDFETRLQDKAIEVRTEFDSRSYRVYANKASVEQIIINLLDNAIKYSAANSVITLNLEEVKEEVVLTVEDEGIGIPPEDIPYIWERFYRVDKARSRDTGGSGLGLAIARQLVEMNEGRIEVQSEPGKGSTFRIYLPLWNEQHL